MGDRLNFQIAWPGVVSPMGVEYVNSHGITPGKALLRILPQPGVTIGESGDLIFQDGGKAITLYDCRLVRLEEVPGGEQGYEWDLHIEDRRWRWGQTGKISGQYNLRDPHNKLISRFIRSPAELAALCLAAMGETDYDLDLPWGLPAAVGQIAWKTLPPWMGVHDVTGSNPAINWDCEVPAYALNALVERLGRRIVFRALTNTVLITVPGAGGPLPTGNNVSIAKATPSIKNPMVPSGILAESSPIKYQMRLRLIPVGRDWDGYYNGLEPIELDGAIAQVTWRIDETGSTTTASRNTEHSIY